MQETQKVIKINRVVNQGISKRTNKPYEIVLVTIEDGSEVEVFGPVKLGDTVGDIQFDEQYNKLKGKLVRPDKFMDILNKLDRIDAQLESIKSGIVKLARMINSGSQSDEVSSPQTRTSLKPMRLGQEASATKGLKPQTATVPSKAEELDAKLEKWRRPSPAINKTPPQEPIWAGDPGPTDTDVPDWLDEDELDGMEQPDDL